MRRGHLTTKEKSAIRRLTKRGLRQSAISRKLGITAESVSRAQKSMGLPTRPVWPEVLIMLLFREEWGGYRIAKHLKVPVNVVYAVAKKHKFKRSDSAGCSIPKGNLAGFKEAVRRGDDYIRPLCGKYGVGICQGYKIAREVRGVPRFRPGVSTPPLSSDFPSKRRPT